MAKFNLTNKAVEDLSKIWDYTYEIWSENQADKYYFELLKDCQVLAENRNLGKNYVEINNDIFGYNSGQHLILFTIINQNEIEIIRFLHSRMDLKNRIQE
ncbi:type II toxin-antitoxin system RelE/ParE family toxin [Flavobacterium sp. F372]|jgi:toxin ParE1/3/4|uniref:Toxin n=1 Tax=Flavobacterium bernardetii TaxID=2813823 RepID=A0ABR7J2D3_9FLAO|nr:type II toxin-antitoxin system RelE/ParE family toxin [Flavobacterium bernardetii]MBC5836205.1 type II toxin-antitoxin system RelE/ParE family toxin [Flavobacterium bernardetii]NHF71431.1 type II toxin-antitoxin system RelE/ParE family toxin [Flavobacterium bernardetii]